MKRRVAQWIGGGLLSTFSILIYLILFHSYLFSTLLINFVNHYSLFPSGISMSGEVVGGFLGKSFGLEKLTVKVIESDATLLIADEITINGWDYDWSTRELTFQNLLINGYSIESQHRQMLGSESNEPPSSISAIIQNIRAGGGQISFSTGGATETIQLPIMRSSLWYIDGFVDAQIHSATAILPSMVSDTVIVNGFLGIDAAGKVNIRNMQLKSGNQNVKLDLASLPDQTSLSLSGYNFNPTTIKNVSLPDWLTGARLHYDVKVLKSKSNLNVSGNGRLLLKGFDIPFELHNLGSNQAGKQLDLSIGSELEHLRMIADEFPSGAQKAQIEMFRFNFEPFQLDRDVRFSQPIGTVSLEGMDNQYNIQSRLKSFTFNNIHFDSLHSDFSFSPDSGIDISQGRITLAKNRLNFTGKLSEAFLDIETDIDVSDFSFLRLPGISNKITGGISSSLAISGSADLPRITGDFRPQNLSYDNKLSLLGQGKIDLVVEGGKPVGNIAFIGDGGFLFGDSLESTTILGNSSSAGYFIEDLHLQGINNLVSMSGGYLDNNIVINKLNIIRGVNQLKLADTLVANGNQRGGFELPTTVLTFNNGGASVNGSFSEKEGYQLNTVFELIDIDQVMEFFKINSDFSGIASGSVAISGGLTDPVFDAKLLLKKGVTLGYPSDSARVDLRLSSLNTYSNNIDAYTSGGYLNLVGNLPWGYKVKGKEIGNIPQNFSVQAENYRLKDLKFTSFVGLPISGRTTGSLSIRGTPVKTKMDIQLSLANASFDTLKFSQAYSELNYEGNLLTFDTLSMVTNWGYGSGSGYMPVSLDLIAEDRLSVASRDMGLDFQFILNEMPFLSSYISSIDAIQGDFIGNLSFTGPFSDPIRNGKMRGHNGRLEISVLGNPITNVHAEVSLIDNTLTIDHFSGRMKFSGGSNLKTQGAVGWLATKAGDLIGVKSTQTYAGDITATGNINLESFFEPRFNIALKANEVYYRSTDGLIEAIADAELTFRGQDTLNVEAVIPVLRAGYYANFESETSYEEIVSKIDSSLFKYSLNTQFPSDLLISNDQLEAEFEGELWLLDYGDGIMRFTGTLKVLDGGKFYYLGNELDLVSGEIIFNSVDFNPQIAMAAEIDIDGERVSLELTGDLSEPELVITAENTQLTQSDVLTYLTLNKTLVEVSFDETALDPVKTYGEILMEKQISKLGREYIGLDLVGVDLASDSTANARLRLGQRLSKNFMVTYEGAIQPTDGETDYDFGFEYQINKNVSVTSKINQNGEIELNGRLKFTY